MTRAELEQAAKASLEVLKRYSDNPLLRYIPCCSVHGGRKPDTWDKLNPSQPWIPNRCPVYPCPDSKHTKFHQSKAHIRFILGGNRSSKTFTCLKEFLFHMTLTTHPFTGETFRQGNRHGRVLAQDYATHEKIHIPELKKWIPKASLKDGQNPSREDAWANSYDSRNHILHLVKDGWIDFLTYDQDPSKGESVDLDIWFSDEEVPEVWFDACNSRLTTRDGIGILGVTPLFGLSWSMDLLTSTDPRTEIFRWTIWDNPHNSKKSIDGFLAQASLSTRESRETGALMDFKGLRYPQLDKDVHFVDFKEPYPTWPVICAVDPHQRKGTYVTWAYVDPTDTVVFFDEMHITGTVRDVVKVIREREMTHKARTMVRLIDPAADKQVEGYGEDISTLDTFEKEGMSFMLAYNARAGYDVVEEYLAYDKTKPLSSTNRPSCYFTRNCEQTWRSMTRLMWDEHKMSQRFSRDPKERVKDKDKDFPDCVRYSLAFRSYFSSASVNPVEVNYQLG